MKEGKKEGREERKGKGKDGSIRRDWGGVCGAEFLARQLLHGFLLDLREALRDANDFALDELLVQPSAEINAADKRHVALGVLLLNEHTCIDDAMAHCDRFDQTATC